MFPKWIMNSETNLVPTGVLLRRARFWQYQRLVRGTYAANLVRYWPLRETSGTVARDASNNRDNGVYTSVTFGQPGIGDGHQCPQFNGSSSKVNVFSTALRSSLDVLHGSMVVWAQMFSAAQWTDGLGHFFFSLTNGIGDYIRVGKPAANGTLQFVHMGGATNRTLNLGSQSDTVFMHLAITWDSTAGQVKFYKNGSQVGSTLGGPGAWGGLLDISGANIGCLYTGLQFHYGALDHAALWNVALPAQVIKRLSRF